MIKNLIKKFLTISFFLLTMVVILTVSTNVLGQCEKADYEKSSFNTVSVEYQEKLFLRFEAFLQNKCKENFEDLYEMLTPSFRELNKKEDFIQDMKSYYSGDDKFISFTINTIAESISPKDNKASIWFIEGCLTEIINGKKRSVKTVLEAIRENEVIYFTDITTRPVPLGENQKCKIGKMER